MLLVIGHAKKADLCNGGKIVTRILRIDCSIDALKYLQEWYKPTDNFGRSINLANDEHRCLLARIIDIEFTPIGSAVPLIDFHLWIDRVQVYLLNITRRASHERCLAVNAPLKMKGNT